MNQDVLDAEQLINQQLLLVPELLVNTWNTVQRNTFKIPANKNLFKSLLNKCVLSVCIPSSANITRDQNWILIRLNSSTRIIKEMLRGHITREQTEYVFAEGMQSLQIWVNKLTFETIKCEVKWFLCSLWAVLPWESFLSLPCFLCTGVSDGKSRATWAVMWNPQNRILINGLESSASG